MMLIQGDNLKILQTFPNEYVDLIYADPPFNSKKDWIDFKDTFTEKDIDDKDMSYMCVHKSKLYNIIEEIGDVGKGKFYLYFMALRIIELHRVLKNTGSIYLHCDPTMSHYLKLVMDVIFGTDNFKNEIIWDYGKVSNATSKRFLRGHDVILFYTKNRDALYNRLFDSELSKRKQQLIKAGYNTKIMNGEKYLYVYNKDVVDTKIKNGQLDIKQFDIVRNVDITRGNAITDVWDIKHLNSMAKERTGYPTQKPLALLDRIIQASTNKGDVVLDPFCGSGTTLVSAKRLGRKWIGIDVSKKSIEMSKDRLNKTTQLC